MKDHPVKWVNFIFLDWNSGIHASSFWPLNQSVMSVWSKHFRHDLNVWAIRDTEFHITLINTFFK